jgi:hypothetical protein
MSLKQELQSLISHRKRIDAAIALLEPLLSQDVSPTHRRRVHLVRRRVRTSRDKVLQFPVLTRKPRC